MSSVGGTYTLLLSLGRPATVEVGALGPIEFDAGWYAYTGSALGPGGFARIDRHRELVAGERATRHWHIDYLLGHADTAIDAVCRSPGDTECGVAAAVAAAGRPVPEFGCSDCGCDSHLVQAPDRGPLAAAIRDAHLR